MPFPYKFPFKFEEFGRYLRLTTSIAGHLNINSSLVNGLAITSSIDNEYELTPSLSEGLKISSGIDRQFNITSEYKTG